MNKTYEEGRKPFFSESGKTERKQYVWSKNEKNEDYLQETTPIDIQAEIESYADECDIKSIVRKASFDPEFATALSAGTQTGEEIDITNWPTNIHEYHKMIATAQAKAMELQNLGKMTKEANKRDADQSQANDKVTKEEAKE